MRNLCLAFAAVFAAATVAHAQATGTLTVIVQNEKGPVAQAEVTVGRMKVTTGPDGILTLSLPPGRIDVVITKEDFDPSAAQVQIRAGMESKSSFVMTTS